MRRTAPRPTLMAVLHLPAAMLAGCAGTPTATERQATSDIESVRSVYRPGDANGLESGAAYWHMVDLVWLVLFPLVYVMH